MPRAASLPPLSPLEMSVRTADGILLKGILEYPETGTGRRHPLAVLAHQYPATSDSYAPLIEDLLDLGAAVLAFDLRGHGASVHGPGGPVVIDTPEGFGLEPFGAAFMSSIKALEFHRIDNDILRVAGWGAAQNFIDPGRLALVGASVGGSGVLLAAPAMQGLRAVVTFGAAGALAFGDDGSERIRRNLEALQAPALLTSSEQDPFSGADNVRNWSRDLPRVQSRLVPGDAHAMGIYYEVRQDVVKFLDQHLIG